MAPGFALMSLFTSIPARFVVEPSRYQPNLQGCYIHYPHQPALGTQYLWTSIIDLPRPQVYTCILVIVDLFTKMAHFVPCSKPPTAPETAQLYLQYVLRLHGLLTHLISDRGSQFTSRFWQALHTSLGIQVHLSSAYHPQTDGETECINATLEQYLRCYTCYQQDDWATLPPLAEFAYNNTIHLFTKQTPFAATYRYHPCFFPTVLPSTIVPAAHAHVHELQALQDLLQEQLQQAKDAYNTAANRKWQQGPPLKPGDQVWLCTCYLR